VFLPSVFGWREKIYMVGAVVLGIAAFYFGARLAFLKMPISAPRSKMLATARAAGYGDLSSSAVCLE